MARQKIHMNKYRLVVEYHAKLQDQFKQGLLIGKMTGMVDTFCRSIHVSPSWYWHERLKKFPKY